VRLCKALTAPSPIAETLSFLRRLALVMAQRSTSRSLLADEMSEGHTLIAQGVTSVMKR